MRLTRENFRIISGGQTGVDRAALDVAIALDIPHGGWCPKGRRAEDGIIPPQYNLQETTSDNYMTRTIRNVGDAHGTLILSWGPMTGGTFRTCLCAEEQKKPWHRVDISQALDAISFGDRYNEAYEWFQNKVVPTVSDGHALVLNVAGPRQSMAALVYAQAMWFLDGFLERLGFYPERGKTL